ncbi:MAG: hypothetical protein D6705_03300 [Deltaproteobacteria bacterium]|nr:MAG: hypothetical protein D6705_03300 [Deltaproteobacteria bacterium]
MNVEEGCVVTLTYDLTTEDGEIVESSDITGPISFIVGRGAIIKGLDRRLIGLSVGDERDFEFPPEEAFGRVEDAPIQVIPTSELPKDASLQKGMRFEAKLPNGQPVILQFEEQTDQGAKMRVLHPLAGRTIGMSIKVEAVRPATAAEKASGRVQTKPPAPPPSSK